MLHQIIKKIAEKSSNLDNDALCDSAIAGWHEFSTVFHYLYSSDRDSFLYGWKGEMEHVIPNTFGFLREDTRKGEYARKSIDWPLLYSNLATISLAMIAQIEYNEYKMQWSRPDYFGESRSLSEKMDVQIKTKDRIRKKLNIELKEVEKVYMEMMRNRPPW